MEDTESFSSYESVTNNPKTMLGLRGKYVKLQLIQNRTVNGYVCAIDPEGHSIILQEARENHYKPVLIPSQAIQGISVKEYAIEIKPPVKIVPTNLQERKRKVMSWFEKNLITVSEENDNIVVKSVLILPPYNAASIYSQNINITRQIRAIIEKMPHNFSET